MIVLNGNLYKRQKGDRIMTNREKYEQAFRDAFQLGDDEDVTNLAYKSIPQWDSVGHMGLVACIEEAFEIMLETDDMIDFSSYDVGVEMLKKYDVDVASS